MTLTERIIYLGRIKLFKWENICPQCFYLNLFTDKRPTNSCHRCGFRRDI